MLVAPSKRALAFATSRFTGLAPILLLGVAELLEEIIDA
jgi:hypothetical protein